LPTPVGVGGFRARPDRSPEEAIRLLATDYSAMTESQQRYCQLRRDVGLLRGSSKARAEIRASSSATRLAETETEAELALVGPPNPRLKS
jgi:hypothetical protein